jgi:enterochelin esterase-like enzyme
MNPIGRPGLLDRVVSVTGAASAATLRRLIGHLLFACISTLALADSGRAQEQLPQVATGRIERLANFPSMHVAPRHVDVWLPADYSPGKRYQVLYMHDGQNLFDGRHAFGGKPWQADVAVQRAVKSGRLADTIIVGIWNAGPERYAEYYPEKFLAHAPEAARREYVDHASNGSSKADAYLRYLVEELKPAIDRRYPTKPGPESTFVIGSSMGGLISLYALCEYPQVFGGAAGLSTHWVGRPTAWGRERVRNAALPLAAMVYLSQNLPPAGRHRIYTDRGDDWLDSLYAPAHRFVGEVLRDHGYTSRDAMTPVVDGTGHTEADWAARLEVPLRFLMARQ